MVWKSTRYLNFIKEQDCLICGRRPEPHHEDYEIYNSGIGMKPPDSQSLPLCREHHTIRHNIGAKRFWDEFNIDYKVQIINFVTKYLNEKEIK